MYIAMNRFSVVPGQESAFEDMWRDRQSYLNDVPGFLEFHLLRGPSNEESTLYASHSRWDSREAFKAWTKSEAFQRAHGKTHSTEQVIVGHPQFEGFDAVL